MIVVLDASAAVKLVLDEVASTIVRRLWDEEMPMVSPTVVVPEVAAAIGAARRAGRLNEGDAASAHRSWVSLVEDIPLLTVDSHLAERARAWAADRTVRGMDAVYLGVASMLGAEQEAGLLSFDGRQRSAVRPDDGVHLLPADVAQNEV